MPADASPNRWRGGLAGHGIERAGHGGGAARRSASEPIREVFLTTKLRPRHLRHADLLRSSEASLADLGVDAIGLLLLPWPNPDVPLEETLGALHEARARGMTRHVGVSELRAVAAAPGRGGRAHVDEPGGVPPVHGISAAAPGRPTT